MVVRAQKAEEINQFIVCGVGVGSGELVVVGGQGCPAKLGKINHVTGAIFDLVPVVLDLGSEPIF